MTFHSLTALAIGAAAAGSLLVGCSGASQAPAGLGSPRQQSTSAYRPMVMRGGARSDGR